MNYSPSEIIFFVAAFLALSLPIRLLNKRTAQTLREVAKQIGFTYQAEQGDAPSLQIHPAKEIRNIMLGSASGFETLLYQYMYEKGPDLIVRRSNRMRIFDQTVAAFKMPVTLPEFEMRPETFINAIGSVLGQQDIDFDSNPEFSKRYLLRGDETHVRQLFRPALLKFFERLEEEWSVECKGMWLVVYRFNCAVKTDAAAYREFVHKTSFIASAVYKSSLVKHES